ncbi:MAG: fumarylacetoacetate hydrolase family protein [Burkholderiaceae bacterium]
MTKRKTTDTTGAADTLSGLLVSAWRSGRALDAGSVPVPANANQAYEIQQAVARQMGWSVETESRAWKVGAASVTAQPNAAFLWAHGVFDSPGRTDPGQLPFLGVEAEIALRIGGVTTSSGQPAQVEVDAVCVSIEMVSSRFRDAMTLDPLLKLADQGLHHSLVLGQWVREWSPDWSTIDCRLRIDGRLIAEARGAHPCGDPMFALPWLARHAAAVGLPLRAGDVVTTGSWLGLVELNEASIAEVEFDGVGSAAVERVKL